MQISKHLTLEDCLLTKHPELQDKPDEFQIKRIRLVANAYYEPCYEYFNGEIEVESFYRGEILNEYVGGAKDSHHRYKDSRGAIDIRSKLGDEASTRLIYEYFQNNHIFDQLIIEKDQTGWWVHISLNISSFRNMSQIIIK